MGNNVGQSWMVRLCPPWLDLFASQGSTWLPLLRETHMPVPSCLRLQMSLPRYCPAFWAWGKPTAVPGEAIFQRSRNLLQPASMRNLLTVLLHAFHSLTIRPCVTEDKRLLPYLHPARHQNAIRLLRWWTEPSTLLSSQYHGECH